MAATKQTDTFAATGRRKTAVARVSLVKGSGAIEVNGKGLDEYFDTKDMIDTVRRPFVLADRTDQYDARIVVRGGGKVGQCGAIAHGAARALIQAEEELKSVLKKAGMLTRDARMKERKKPGQPGARKRFQFSKR